MKMKLQDLDEIKNLSQQERDLVLQEYGKAYHFLLFYGKLFGWVLLILSLGYLVNLLKSIDWPFRFLILMVVSYPLSILLKIVEINIVAKRVIRDLLKDLRAAGKIRTK